MKLNKIYLVAFLAAALQAPSCTNDFLEEEMVATITQDYFNTEQGMDELLTGTYDAFRQNLQYNQGPETFFYGVDTWTAANATISNYSASQWNSTAITANTIDELCAQYSNSMLGWYPTVNGCNRVIQTIDEGKGLGKYAEGGSQYHRAKAEALFNRAYCIYQMNTFLGDLYFPRTYTNAMPQNFAFSRESSESIYSQLISDLQYSFEYLPETVPDPEYGRATKAAAAHFLAKLYLTRYMGKDYGTAEYGRNADGSIDNSNPKSYLGMLYKGSGANDLDSVIYYSNYVIERHALAPNYADIFRFEKGDHMLHEGISEIVFAMVFGTPSGNASNGRFANRLQYFIGPAYMVAQWGLPSEVWASYRGRSNVGGTNDFGFDLYTNKTIDSRFEGSFWVEMEAMNGADPYFAYNDAKNVTYKWTDEQADFFNANILADYDRPSWGGRQAVAEEHKIGTGDVGYAFLENTKETAIDEIEALSQPFFLFPRWIKSADGKIYYRPTRETGDYAKYKTNAHGGLNTMAAETSLRTRKYSDPDRESITANNSSRDVPIFRAAEAYLMRAYAYGAQGNYGLAVADINAVRERAAYHAGETRAQVIARLYPGAENLPAADRQYPYTVTVDTRSQMSITAAAWDGSSAQSKAEMYPEQNIAGSALSEADRFQNFWLNEISREFNQEFVYSGWLHHSGWQYARILYHCKEASTLAQGPDYWPVADNEVTDGALTDRKGMGFLQPYHTLKPFRQSTIDLLTDENNVLLDAAGRKAYQNYGY